MAHPIYNQETIRQRLNEECNQLSIQLYQILLDSTPDRPHKCLKAKVGEGAFRLVLHC